MIAPRTIDNGDQIEKTSADVRANEATDDEAYEVRRSRPRLGDSYVGGLDILTVHRMIEEQNAESEANKRTQEP